MGVKEFMHIEISKEYDKKVYELYHLNRIEENRILLRNTTQRFVLFLKLSRFVIDVDSGKLFSIDHKLKHFLHTVGEKNMVISMFIDWYKTSWLDYETLFKPNYEYLLLNLNLFLNRDIVYIPVVKISSNYVHFINGLHNMDTRQFYLLNDMKIKNVYTTNKIEQNYK